MIIGITGSLATGTSTAAKYIASSLKAEIIDADKVANIALKKNSPVYKSLIKGFGKDILNKNGTIDKSSLARRAFSSRPNLKKLCDITHPFIIEAIRKQISIIQGGTRERIAIVDGPLLIESKFYKKCDIIIVVISSLLLQIERACNNRSIKENDALCRIQHQMPLYKKVGYADYIIDNGGSLKELKQKCRKITKKIKKET
ncbi:MAG: dephospho-CoA kinase [Candidatus Omnitrophica bacterium]|nr:dephospho-CoA kinase [Candidatus Omnitrophota bacterium]